MYTLHTTTLFLFGLFLKGCKGAECGGNLTEPGIITSPNFPSNYTNDVQCTWDIRAPVGYLINVNFTDFELGDYIDYLKLSNGPNASSREYELYFFFGNAPLNEFKSQSNTVRIVFTTDIRNTARGFNMTYTFSVQACPLGRYGINCFKQCHCRMSSCDDISGACGDSGCKYGWHGIACNEKCGGNLTEPGIITSPNFPSNYTNNVQCTWDIRAPVGYLINVNFTDFALEVDVKCNV
ncbi:hypothetical protein DPMN_119279 [Dreissena polymorpha]|uniref:CUB domain-containing protein n=1 Tax=Dreissena polymorpha TaxID=45954 RepID=A0A9D4GLN6_DREPO|nr:hypothetical protein DPMN_119279 [Dreissena polymorpha]